MKMQKKEYIFDLIRTFAILSVVFCHSIESVYYIFQDRAILYQNISVFSKIFDLTGITIGRLGVPIFLFLTGALLGSKTFNNNGDIKKFYKKKLIPLLTIIEIWIIIWNIFILAFFSWRNETPIISIFSLLQNIFLLKTVDYILPAWYAPMIIGIYLFIPFVAIIINKFDFKTLKIPLIVSIIYFFALPTANVILNIYNINLTSNIDLFFSGGVFGLYIILGFFINKGLLRNIKSYILYLIFMISFISCIIFQYSLTTKEVFYKLSYDNIFLLICSCSLFEIFIRVFTKKKIFPKFCEYISKISFPIFLIHNLIQYIIFQSNIFSDFIRPINVVCNFILTMVLVIICIKLLSLNKYTKKYLLKL